MKQKTTNTNGKALMVHIRPQLTPRAPSRRAAFSLIEVNMALLVVSLGLAALLGLFPVGLRESSLASADTTEAIFATRVLNALQANAAEIKTWTDWKKNESFTKDIVIDGTSLTADSVQEIAKAGGIDKNTIRYLLKLGPVADTADRMRYAAIQVADDKYSDINNNVIYYTEFRYGKN